MPQLSNLDLLCRDQLITVLALFEELHDATAKAIKVFKHDQSLNVGQCLFSVRVECFGSLAVPEGRPYDVLDSLRRQELVLEHLQVWLVSETHQIGVSEMRLLRTCQSR